MSNILFPCELIIVLFNIKNSTIAGLARAKLADIDRAWEAVKHAKSPRIHTFIATSPIHMKYKLKKGDCLMFDNLDNYNLDTSQSLHSGCSVKGEKWIANLWVRTYPHQEN